MKQFFRAVAWLLFLGGLAMSYMAIMADRGVAPFGIEVFSPGTAATGQQRIVVWVCAAAVGLILLRLTRRNWTRPPGR